MAELRDVQELGEVEIEYLAATPEVIPLLANWYHEQWRELSGKMTVQRRVARLKHHLQRNAIPTTFVAWSQGYPIGSASLVATDIEELSEWIPWLANVYVVPEKRRSGVGAALVQRTAQETVALGYPRLYLYTLDQMHFYESLGWHISHVRFHRGHDMTVMIRDLIVNPPPPLTHTLPIQRHQASP